MIVCKYHIEVREVRDSMHYDSSSHSSSVRRKESKRVKFAFVQSVWDAHRLCIMYRVTPVSHPFLSRGESYS